MPNRQLGAQQAFTTTNWRCGEERVYLASHADIPRQFKPGAPKADITRRALAVAPPMARDQERFICSIKLNDVRMLPLAIEASPSYPRTWAIHMDHQARRPGLSPFATLPAHELPQLMTDLLTLEVVRGEEMLLLVRAYPGQYVPPLPSMRSAENAPGGIEACKVYWREHAYLVTDHLNRISPGTMRPLPPPWFT